MNKGSKAIFASVHTNHVQTPFWSLTSSLSSGYSFIFHPGHGPANPYRCRQLCRLLQRAGEYYHENIFQSVYGWYSLNLTLSGDLSIQRIPPFQKKLEAKELKREAQTVEDKWEMRKAILAKEALIESVCSTTKVG